MHARGNPKLLLVLLVLSAALHFFRLSDPDTVVFDEVHFGRFVNAYCGSGAYFFDIHPPHAKLLIAGAAALGGYRGEQAFDVIHTPITEISPTLLRLVPAFAGTLLPPLLFVFMLQLGASRAAALLVGLGALLDNALLLQTRIIALDGVLLLSTFGSLSCLLAARGCQDRLKRTGFAVAAGTWAGLAAGTKFTGLAALFLIGICLAVDVLHRRDRVQLRAVASLAVWILSAAVAVYALGWVVHFGLLPGPGPGDIWGRPEAGLLSDTVHVHRSMLASNYGLAASHPAASPWWSWPLMLRSVLYWSYEGALLSLLGNPVLWWGTTLGMVVLLTNLVLFRVTRLEVAGAESPWPRCLWLPVCGYLVVLVPLMFVPRPLFLYHYLTPLLFALCAVVLWLDHAGWTRSGGFLAQRRSVQVVAAALLLGFIAMSPFTFAFVNAPGYREFLFGLFPGWR